MAMKNDGLYTISTKGGKLLEVGELCKDDGGLVRIWNPTDGDAQRWRLMEAGDGFYRIVNVFSGKALDIVMQGSENGTLAHQWEITDSDSQLWSFSSIGRGYYKIMAKSTGKCLDRVSAGVDEGTPVQIWDDVGGESQKWRVAEFAGVTVTAEKARTSSGRSSAKKPKGSMPRAAKKKVNAAKA